MFDLDTTQPHASRARRRRPEGRGRELVLAIEGRFDLAAAQRTAEDIRARIDVARVVIDLRRAPVDDVAIAVLARELPGRPVVVVGLTRHHERLLRYLGPRAGGTLGVADG